MSEAAALRSAADIPEVGVAGPARRQRGIEVPQLLFALLCVALFALAAVWWQARSTDRKPVLAVASDVAVGEALEPADLMTVFVNVDQPVRLVAEQSLANFVGSVATIDVLAGSLLTPEMFALADPLASDEAFVGVVVAANARPGSLVPGDAVLAVIVAGEAEAVPSIPATVERVGAPTPQNDVTVELRVSAAAAIELAVAAANQDIVLIEVPATVPAEGAS